MESKIACLDKGYVRLVTWMPWDMVAIMEAIDGVIPSLLGDCYDMYAKLKPLMGKDDLSSVNAARVSFVKESVSISDGDRRLIKFLAERSETSPFRHAFLTFEIKAPMMVARQWFKYRVGATHSNDTSELLGLEEAAISMVGLGQGDDGGFDDPMYGRNESSRRYVTAEPEFYIPSEWRSAPANRKQGSSGPLLRREQDGWTNSLMWYIKAGLKMYDDALAGGMAPEQARLFLPAYGLYLTWRWTASLAAVCHFLKERLAEKAQKEMDEYAQAVWHLAVYAYPECVNALVNHDVKDRVEVSSG